MPSDTPYTSIIANVLQSEEEEGELVRDEEATKHEIVQDDIKKKVPDEWFWLGKPSLFQQLKKLRNVISEVSNGHCERI